MDARAYYTAQVCENGHTVTSMMENFPGREENYCSKCGVKTLSQCSHCGDPIRGHSRYQGDSYARPAYCPECSKPYPWTEAALKAARDLAAIELGQQELNEFAAVVENLVTDTPQTAVAAARFRRLMAKVTPITVESFKAILINVTTEAAKRLMFPGPG